MGIRREMMMTGLARLTPTRAEIGGWPPLAVSFQHPQDLPPPLLTVFTTFADSEAVFTTFADSEAELGTRPCIF